MKIDKENLENVHIPFKKIGARRMARQVVLQMLYLCDNCGFSAADALNARLHDEEDTEPLPVASRNFAKTLLEGIIENRETLDAHIVKYAKNWDLKRMALIDRNILRLAAYEIVYTPETPVSVIIDEAVEIAKTFSTDESGKFVNGIIDKIQAERKKK